MKAKETEEPKRFNNLVVKTNQENAFDKDILNSNVYCRKCNENIGIKIQTITQNKFFLINSIVCSTFSMKRT